MSYGHLTLKMRALIKPLIKGRKVHDLAAGDMELSRLLIRLGGVAQVTAIEKESHHRCWYPPRRLQIVKAYIHEVPIPHDIDVVFLSWPPNYPMRGLMPWLQCAQTIIYLGMNLDGAACGFPEMFQHFSYRELVGYVEHDKNNLLILQGNRTTPREPTLEEQGHFSSSILRRDGSTLLR